MAHLNFGIAVETIGMNNSNTALADPGDAHHFLHSKRCFQKYEAMLKADVQSETEN